MKKRKRLGSVFLPEKKGQIKLKETERGLRGAREREIVNTFGDLERRREGEAVTGIGDGIISHG